MKLNKLMGLIDKDAVVAKIAELRFSTMDEDGSFYSNKTQAEYNILCELECFLDTLEVKEVDLYDKGEWKNTGGFGSTYDPDSPDYCPD